MSKYTEQRNKDVARIVEFTRSDPYFYSFEELIQRAWEFGVAYAQGYGMNYPTKGEELDRADTD